MSDIEITKPSNALVFDPAELSADSAADGTTRAELYTRQGVHSVEHSSGPAPDTDWVSKQNPEDIVRQVTSKIGKLQSRLDTQAGGFHESTGQPKMLLEGRERVNAERELASLTHTSLPFAKATAADIARQQAALPSADDRLIAEGERKARIEARGLSIAEEREAEAVAERLLRSRR